jgi:SAM-dependent methyltransferase
MFGWLDAFEYFQCSSCGCLQIASVPNDLDRFYPSQYYSFHLQPVPQRGLRAKLAALRDRSILTGSTWLAKPLEMLARAHPEVTSLAIARLNPQMSILDVGCGRGQLLSVLYRAGFSNIQGIDPYLPDDVEVVTGVVVHKRSIEQVTGQFDVIMLHHVFEHIAEPAKVLEASAKRLGPGGSIVLRVPTADSFAWDEYRENWVQLDAPRHLFLHTRRSIEWLAKNAGLVVRCWECDSTAFQFWGSELYRKGIPLYGPDWKPTRPEDYFNARALSDFEAKAKEINASGRGDQVVAVLSHAHAT